MLRVNTAAIIQSAMALVVAITVADGLRDTIRWLSPDYATGALGVRFAITLMLVMVVLFFLNKCGDHTLDICIETPHETYKNTPLDVVNCTGTHPCKYHGEQRWLK